MKVYLAGCDDLGYWFLEDENGNSFDFVTTEAEQLTAAALFGWKAPEGVSQERAVEEARLWLEDCIRDKIDAPKDAEAYFQELYGDEESE
jgi:hypothetical protein